METKDGIKRFKSLLIELNVLTEEQAAVLQEEAKQEIEASVEFAKNSKEPSIDTLLEDVYA